MDIFGFRLPSPGEAWNWLKNWAETYIYNPILFVLKQIKAGVIWLAIEVAEIALAVAGFFSELKRRFLATLNEGVRLAKALTTTAINEVRSWVFGWLKTVWETLKSATKKVTDWALGKLADLWVAVNSLLGWILDANAWFVKMFQGAVDASAGLIYNALVRFINAIW